MTHIHRGATAGAAAVLFLAGCGTAQQTPGDGTTATATETSTATATTTATATDTATATTTALSTVTVTSAPRPDETQEPVGAEAPFPADRRPDTAQASGSRLQVADLRFGRHQSYERVVVELDGNGKPGWRAEYVSDPRQAASGRPVDVRGNATLEVTVEGVTYPEPGADPYRGPSTLTPEGTAAVAEVRHGPLFEGRQQIFVGTTSELPFRVFRLEGPPRVVIDVVKP